MRLTIATVTQRVPVAILFAVVVPALRSQPSESTPAWIQRGDAYSAQVEQVEQQLRPEAAASNAALDDQITDLSATSHRAATRMLQRLLRRLQAQRRRETDADVRQDLDILIDHVQSRLQGIELGSKYELPYVDATQVVLEGISALLDDQIAAKRQPSASVRLRKYAGLESGIPPLTQSAERRLRQALAKSNLLAPARRQVERNLSQANRVLDDVAGLFEKRHIGGYEKALTTLRSQIAAYNQFIRTEVLPRCPIDRRLPPELYAFRWRNTFGVDMPPSELARVARAAFRDTQDEMQALAAQVADARHLSARDYRSVIADLKRDQLRTDAIVAEYNRCVARLQKTTWCCRMPSRSPKFSASRTPAAERHIFTATRNSCDCAGMSSRRWARFDRLRFHDFVVAQGKIPIPIIRQAIFQRFVKSPS